METGLTIIIYGDGNAALTCCGVTLQEAIDDGGLVCDVCQTFYDALEVKDFVHKAIDSLGAILGGLA